MISNTLNNLPFFLFYWQTGKKQNKISMKFIRRWPAKQFAFHQGFNSTQDLYNHTHAVTQCYSVSILIFLAINMQFPYNFTSLLKVGSAIHFWRIFPRTSITFDQYLQTYLQLTFGILFIYFKLTSSISKQTKLTSEVLFKLIEVYKISGVMWSKTI